MTYLGPYGNVDNWLKASSLWEMELSQMSNGKLLEEMSAVEQIWALRAPGDESLLGKLSAVRIVVANRLAVLDAIRELLPRR